MKPVESGGSRIGIVFNASPLFTGAAGSGESEIRRWIIENDWLEAIVALPDQLFYNTGIPTYIWIVTNRKPDFRRGKVQLIDRRGFYERMPRSLGAKRHRIPDTGIEAITRLFAELEANDKSLILDNATFGYHRIVIERPLRLRYELSQDTLATLAGEKGFLKLDAETRGKVTTALEHAVANGAPNGTNATEFASAIKEIVASVNGFDRKQVTAITKLVAGAGTVHDPEAPIVVDSKGKPLPDAELRDYEQVPFGEDIDEEVVPVPVEVEVAVPA
jgi:type I restriction enzyme M protein